MIGTNEQNFNKLHLCDFGLAKYYMVPKEISEEEKI